ncbi:unnamed protein product, partial [Rotaria sp. Silwood2]
LQVKKNNSKLFPYTIITHPKSHTLSHIDSTETESLEFDIVNMADQTLLTKARKARFDDLPNFSGHPSEDVERFLKSIKNITKVTDESDNQEILEIVHDFEIAFRNRYFSTTSTHKKFDTLKQRKQLPDESITSYCDDIINLCKEIDSNMSEKIIIQYLMSGINPDFRKELSRRASSINTLNEFLKYAKIEQDLHDTFRNLSIDSQQHHFNCNHSSIPSLTATVNPQKQYHYKIKYNNPISHSTQSQSPVSQRNSIPTLGNRTSMASNRKQIRNYPPPSISKKKTNNSQPTSQHQFNSCKVCGRKNHRTIDCYYKRTTGCFNCGENHNPSTITSFPVYIKIRVNDQPTEAIVDTGSAISIIHSNFLKTIHHKNFIYKNHTCQTANSTPLKIIGQIELEIQIKSIKTYVTAHVATNLITSILLGNDWINSNHVHLYGDQQQLTIPDQYGQSISIPYVEPTSINYPALLVHEITLPPYSQKLVDITCQVTNANNLIFEPYERHISKFIFVPHTLLNINKNHAKVLLINAQNRQQTLSKNTRIGTISRDATYTIYATTQISTKHNSILNERHQTSTRHYNKLKSRAILRKKDNSNQEKLHIICHHCNEHFLSGNDLQKHLRAQCYSEQIRQQIIESTAHIENPKHRLAIQDILWRNKILFDPTPSIINIPPQSAIKTGDHPPIYSKQYPASYKDQEIKLH